MGDDIQNIRKKLTYDYLPNKIIIGSKKKSNLDILKNKFVKGETMIYVCQKGACQRPTKDPQQALSEIIY